MQLNFSLGQTAVGIAARALSQVGDTATDVVRPLIQVTIIVVNDGYIGDPKDEDSIELTD